MMQAMTMAAVLCLTAAADERAAPMVVNGGLEQGLDGWQRFWSRGGEGQAVVDRQAPRAGAACARIEYPGSQDWSFQQERPLAVQPGQIYELTGWVRVRGTGSAMLCVSLRDAQQQVLDWSYGAQRTGETQQWRQLRCRFLIPPGGSEMTVRLIGTEAATVWLDDVLVRQTADLQALRQAELPGTIRLQNRWLDVEFDTATAALAVTDRRCERRWQQAPSSNLVVLSAVPDGNTIRFGWLDNRSMLQGTGRLAVVEEAAEIELELAAEGEFSGSIDYPPPWITEPGMSLILPVNEGISYPVDDESLPEMNYHLYGGHGLCMGWYGIIAGQPGVMALVETPDDAAVLVPRRAGRLTLAAQWQPQRGCFGPPRRMRHVFFDRDNYVAMCQHYRGWRETLGLVKTLAEKRQENPLVDRLVGAVNVWCWERDAVGICRQLQEAGIDRILWSNRAAPEVLQQLNAMEILTSRYDIYQDAMDPANFSKLSGLHADWTSSAWPHDLAIDSRGEWIRGWNVRGKDGQWYPCGVLCDRRALDYARARLSAELPTHPYGCRFIDTTTASSWRECYHPEHPMTRSESRHWKMELLRLISQEYGLVTGSETGHEAAVPYVHYFEGMLSLGPYRIPDAGRKMQEIWNEVPERVARFQTGYFYRLPLWELVYHDCVVAQWYWGDYNNKLTPVWKQRDLWNALYGTPPMFMFNQKLWNEQRERFAESYRVAAEVARRTGYCRMLSHRWLNDDHSAQETVFADGTTVTVNFGDQPYTLADGQSLPPLGHRVRGR